MSDRISKEHGYFSEYSPLQSTPQGFRVFASAFLVRFLILGASPENKEARRISLPGIPHSTPYYYMRGNWLKFALLCITVVATIRYYHMVTKMDSQRRTDSLHALSQRVIHSAWANTS